MKAIVFYEYGSPDVLKLAEIGKPEVKDTEVLVRVHAASVNPVDWHRMRGLPYVVRAAEGLRKPRTNGLGADVAGDVQAVGGNVTQFRAGDEVFGLSIATCAEYVAVSEAGLTLKPTNLSFEEAAAVPLAATTALQGLRDKARLLAGQKVLVNGASGGVGTFAVQIARSFEAGVTGVCSTRNVDLVRSLGADRAIDYTQEDFTRGGQRYDLIFDAVGNRSLSECRRVLDPKGTLVLAGAGEGRRVGPMLARLLQAVVWSRFGSQKFVPYLARRSQADLVVLKDLIEAGKLSPVIDRRYPLRDVPDAIRYLEEGHARGKVVITVAG